MGAQAGDDSLVSKLVKSSEVGIAVVVVGIVGMLIIPLPPTFSMFYWLLI